MNWKVVVLIIALACMGVFVLQNLAVVQVRFLFWQLEASRALLYLSLFLLGALVGWIGGSLQQRH